MTGPPPVVGDNDLVSTVLPEPDSLGAAPRPERSFTALVGQESMKRALLLNAVHPAIGGVLIRGEKGTAKSTAVRALASLLPVHDVVAGCRYGCDPDAADRWCGECRTRLPQGSEVARLTRRMRVVELPVSASEDRVVGSIDIEAAIQHGERRFQPGVLAEANRNILYVDEVNLLDDHLVDVLLDAAAMGVNTVEREGVSIAHPSRFLLVGTANEEEGALRPQLLDRFGLCVDVRGLRSVDDRVRVMEQDAIGPEAGRRAAADADARLAAIVATAVELMPLISVPPAIRRFIALVCIEAGVLGHRADIVVHRAARAICALREAEVAVDHRLGEIERNRPADALRVTPDDVVEAAQLALAHRRVDRPDRGEPATGGAPESASRPTESAETPPMDSENTAGQDSSDSAAGGSGGDHAEGTAGQSADRADAEEASLGSPEVVFDGEPFQVRRIALPRDRRTRRTSGKRSRSRSGDRRGRYVRAVQVEKTTDLAFDATLRVAAPHQLRRLLEAAEADGPALRLERQDLRQKVRQRRTGTLIVFVVDASASMDAEQRMQATKGAILSLLRDAYVRRDRVALVVFSGRTARVVLRPTSSIDLAENRLQRLSVGGTTPLTHGLVAGLGMIRTERIRDPSVYPLLVLISDGRGNISMFGDEPLVEAQRVAAQIRQEQIRALVIDSARDYTQAASLPRLPGRPGPAVFGGYAFNACLDLSERLGGTYMGLYDLSQRAILEGVQQSLRSG